MRGATYFRPSFSSISYHFLNVQHQITEDLKQEYNRLIPHGSKVNIMPLLDKDFIKQSMYRPDKCLTIGTHLKL